MRDEAATAAADRILAAVSQNAEVGTNCKQQKVLGTLQASLRYRISHTSAESGEAVLAEKVRITPFNPPLR